MSVDVANDANGALAVNGNNANGAIGTISHGSNGLNGRCCGEFLGFSHLKADFS
jgi:hypothetical protein